METELTPEQVRAYADKVAFGECIIFPNGLVIDKRPTGVPNARSVHALVARAHISAWDDVVSGRGTEVTDDGV